jgi:hypothetical protein
MINTSRIGKSVHKRMKKDESYALMAGIAMWAEDNVKLVELAQRLSHKTLSLGLCDTNAHLPFQIVPVDMFTSDGNLYHELFLNLDHAAWGYFKIIIKNAEEFELVSPAAAPWPQSTFSSEAEVETFIEELGATLDELYQLDEYAEARNWDKMNLILSSMVSKYHAQVDDKLAEVKSQIDSQPMAMIADTNSGTEQFANATDYRYDLALQHPDNWYIARQRSEEEMEKVTAINTKLNKNVLQIGQYAAVEDETEVLRNLVRSFFEAENRESAFLYMAQRILVQKGFEVEVATDSTEGEPDTTNKVFVDTRTGMVFVRPVIHATEIRVTDGPKPKPKTKAHHFGIPILD